MNGDVEAYGNILGKIQKWSKSLQHGVFPGVTQPSTDAAQQDLTLVIGREPVFFF